MLRRATLRHQALYTVEENLFKPEIIYGERSRRGTKANARNHDQIEKVSSFIRYRRKVKILNTPVFANLYSAGDFGF